MELRVGYARQTAHNLPVLGGLHWRRPAGVERIREVRIRAGQTMGLMVDGELLGGVREASIRVLGKALRVRVRKPENRPRDWRVV